MKSSVKLIGLGFLSSAVIWAAINRGDLASLNLEAAVAGFGWAGPLIFILIYAAAAILFLPGSLLTLAGGAIFGLTLGTVYNSIGATLGAGISFLIARGLGADWVEAKTKGKLLQLKEGVQKEDWHFVAFVRLVPLFPFNLLNYALGLTGINFWKYLITSSVTMLPGAFVYTYIGFLSKEAFTGGESFATAGPKALIALGAMALVLYLPKVYFTRKKNSIKGNTKQVKDV